MKVSSVKVFGLVALGTVVGFVDGCGSGAAELSGDFPAVGGQQLVSMAYDSYDPCEGPSKDPVLNHDGRFIAFASKGGDVIANDQTTDGDMFTSHGSGRGNDVFRFDRLTGQNIIASILPTGEQAAVDYGYCAHRADISDDGKIIVFQSKAENLVSGTGPYGTELADVNGYCDVFLKNMVTGVLQCISLPTAIDSGSNGGASSPTISGDGRFVCFESGYDFTPSQLFGSDCGKEIWVYDRTNGTYEIVSCDNDGNAIAHYYDYPCKDGDISGDGRFVVFETPADADGDVDDNGCEDVYRFDRQTKRLELVSANADGQATSMAHQPKISGDGRYVAFKSDASDHVTVDATSPDYDNNGYADVFVRDMQTGVIVCCSRGIGGVDASGSEESGLSQRPSISADGRYIAFDSTATNLVDGDVNDSRDVFVFDRVTGQTRRVANHPCLPLSPEDEPTYICQHTPSISGDGRFVSFMRGGNSQPDWAYPVIMVAPNPFLGGTTDETTPLPPMVGGGDF